MQDGTSVLFLQGRELPGGRGVILSGQGRPLKACMTDSTCQMRSLARAASRSPSWHPVWPEDWCSCPSLLPRPSGQKDPVPDPDPL